MSETLPAPAPPQPARRTLLDVESEAFAVAIAVGIVTLIVGAIVFAGTNPPIWGGVSLGVASAASILIAGIVVAYVGYWRSRSIDGQQWRLELKPFTFIVDATSVALVHSVLAVLAAMATASDPAWWEYHFSQLGTFGDRSSSLFNITLIIAGVLVTTFAIIFAWIAIFIRYINAVVEQPGSDAASKPTATDAAPTPDQVTA